MNTDEHRFSTPSLGLDLPFNRSLLSEEIPGMAAPVFGHSLSVFICVHLWLL